MPAHDFPDRPRPGAHLHSAEDDEPTLVGDERYDDLPRDPVVIVVDHPKDPERDRVD